MNQAVLVARIQTLVNQLPDKFCEFEMEWEDQELPPFTEAADFIASYDINISDKTRCVKAYAAFLEATDENLFKEMSCNTFVECAMQIKKTCQNIYRCVKASPVTCDLKCQFKAELN
jgi:hypothetical protein